MMPQHMYMYCDLFYCSYVLMKFWCQLPEDGKIITLEHVAAI